MAGSINVVRYEQGQPVSLTASAAVSNGQAVEVSGVKTVAPAAAGSLVAGTVIKGAAAGEKASIRLIGDVVPMTAAGAVAAGDQLVANAGNVQTKAAETAEKILGVALTAAAAADEEILVLVR